MNLKKNIKSLWRDISVGQYLAVRELKRSNPWSTALIIFVMTLTFFNMILMGGVLTGLAEGMMNSFKKYYSSDLLIKPQAQYSSITKLDSLNSAIQSLPTAYAKTIRSTTPVIIENDNQIKIRTTEIGERVNATLVGIDIYAEDQVTNISNQVILGNFIKPSDIDGIVIGKSLLSEYSKGSSTEPRLSNISPGTNLNLIIGNNQTTVVVKGIIDTGNTTIDSRIFILESTMRALTNNHSLTANEIALALTPGSNPLDAKNFLLSNYPYSEEISVETAEEALPKAISDMKKTFSMLGNIVGVISLIVGAVTIFIVIFVNAVTRRKYIGILKGIGISALAIEISYIIQSLFFATSGIIIATFIILWFLKPYFLLHPLQFPVTEGSLAITNYGLFIRALILLITSFISGYIPAYLITKQNTLDAILGR